MWYFYLFNALLCIFMAYKDGMYASKGLYRKIVHWRNGLIHCGAAGLPFIFYGWDGWSYAVAILAECAFVFDISMNLFRKFNPFYVSISPRSLKDKIEKFVFRGNGFLAKLFYLLLFLVMAFKLWNYVD